MSLAFIAKRNGEEAAKQVATYLEYTGDYRSLLHAKDDPPLCTASLLKKQFRPLGLSMNSAWKILISFLCLCRDPSNDTFCHVIDSPVSA